MARSRVSLRSWILCQYWTLERDSVFVHSSCANTHVSVVVHQGENLTETQQAGSEVETENAANIRNEAARWVDQFGTELGALHFPGLNHNLRRTKS